MLNIDNEHEQQLIQNIISYCLHFISILTDDDISSEQLRMQCSKQYFKDRGTGIVTVLKLHLRLHAKQVSWSI